MSLTWVLRMISVVIMWASFSEPFLSYRKFLYLGGSLAFVLSFSFSAQRKEKKNVPWPEPGKKVKFNHRELIIGGLFSIGVGSLFLTPAALALRLFFLGEMDFPLWSLFMIGVGLFMFKCSWYNFSYKKREAILNSSSSFRVMARVIDIKLMVTKIAGRNKESFEVVAEAELNGVLYHFTSRRFSEKPTPPSEVEIVISKEDPELYVMMTPEEDVA